MGRREPRNGPGTCLEGAFMKQMVTSEVILAADEVDRLPAEPMSPSITGVDNTAVFDSQRTYAGILRIGSGATLPAHQHRGMGHHVFVLEGSARVFGRTMPAGSYWFVPAGHRHTVQGLPPDGCALFYVDVPER
jgi:hypothetical protein